MKIAVVGSGISGLSASYYLSKKHKVDLFESENHFGGHSYTIDVLTNEKKVPVDIGFIVFNYKTYPNLIKFFTENEVEIEKSDMSFSVSVQGTNFEYSGKGLKGIFANKINLFNKNFLKMFFDIVKFYNHCDKIKSGDFDKLDNPIKNAPHTDLELASDKWDHKYSREEAAYPAKFLRTNKFWPPVARVDNVYGDKNIFCTCPSMDEFKEDAA